MEDEGNHGNDDTRCFILSTLAALHTSRVACVLCQSPMLVFDRYPLVDGTFFLSPRQHSKCCLELGGMWKEPVFYWHLDQKVIKTKKGLKQDCQYLGKDLNGRHPGYEAGFLLTRH
ncbi:hypothetical protein B7P43_G14167 [Cryptotermes secundus]|uniref:Headcase middle domain-containing protein n=1 Tax=Cryptotermes secundus TaxID=105785 RepID=A0A2J7PWN4_9NEOP|nr:hypothetical protein B7P43_G14167 [Cryptotermes secundus]